MQKLQLANYLCFVEMCSYVNVTVQGGWILKISQDPARVAILQDQTKIHRQAPSNAIVSAQKVVDQSAS